jgi:glycosyltransferase involved in cell wall biosynthesis
MRVLQIVSHAVGTAGRRGVGGPEKRALETLRKLDRSRFEPVIVYSRRGVLFDDFSRSRVRLIDFYVRGIEHLAARWTLASVIERERIDVVHTQGPIAADYYAALAAKSTGTPFVVTRPVMIEDYRCHPVRRRAMSLVDRATLVRADRIVAVSEDGRDRLAGLPRVPPDRVVVVRNGVDVEIYRPDPEAKRRLLAEAAPAPEGGDPIPTVGMVAQVTPEKGWDAFLRVVESVRRAHPGVLGFVVGSGPLLGRVEAAAREMDLWRSLRFLGFRTDVERVLPGLDVVLLTSEREGLPVSLIEAMACGRPVVTTDAGGSAELILEGRTGHVVPVGDWRSAADRVVGLLSDRSRLEAMGVEARARAVTEFSLDRMVSDYERLYETLAGSS